MGPAPDRLVVRSCGSRRGRATIRDMRRIVLLGPQRLKPTLIDAVNRLDVRGPFAAVTAGWQEREDEIDELSAHLDRPVANLRLHARGEDVFQRDPELLLAYGDLLDRTRKIQDLYRERLAFAKDAAREMLASSVDPDVLEPEIESAIVVAAGARRAPRPAHREAARGVRGRVASVGATRRRRAPRRDLGGAVALRGGRRRGRTRPGAARSDAAVRRRAADDPPAGLRLVGGRDGRVGARGAVPRLPAAGRRQRRAARATGSALCRGRPAAAPRATTARPRRREARLAASRGASRR